MCSSVQCKGPFKNYMVGGTVIRIVRNYLKNVCFCTRSGYKNCPRRGEGGTKFFPRSCWMPPTLNNNNNSPLSYPSLSQFRITVVGIWKLTYSCSNQNLEQKKCKTSTFSSYLVLSVIWYLLLKLDLQNLISTQTYYM